MSNRVLFQMDRGRRQFLIDEHLFYVEQACKRLLSQFNDIENEAQRAEKEWLERYNIYFDPDRHDPADFYENAHEAGIEFYQLLTDMREQTYLSVVAGMFHEWDKHLRDWLTKEIQHWHRGNNTISAIWSVNFIKITELLENRGWKIRDTEYFKTLDACRLVVNVYKHGNGNSMDELKQNYPEYLDDRFGVTGLSSDKDFRDYTYLKITDEQFQAFSNAIMAFWKGVPAHINNSTNLIMPDWFEKAISKDRNAI